MPAEYSLEVRETAEEMYVIDGLTFHQISQRTGVSATQLQRWGQESEWVARRHEYRQALQSIRRDTVDLRRNLIKKAAQSLDAQDAYAVARLESIFSKKTAAAAAPAPEITTRIGTAADAVAALKQAVELKINEMLSVPGTIDLAAVKNIKQALELLEKMEIASKAGVAPDEAAAGLTDETIRKIRTDVLGITE